jgi:hypothetical protein
MKAHASAAAIASVGSAAEEAAPKVDLLSKASARSRSAIDTITSSSVSASGDGPAPADVGSWLKDFIEIANTLRAGEIGGKRLTARDVSEMNMALNNIEALLRRFGGDLVHQIDFQGIRNPMSSKTRRSTSSASGAGATGVSLGGSPLSIFTAQGKL